MGLAGIAGYSTWLQAYVCVQSCHLEVLATYEGANADSYIFQDLAHKDVAFEHILSQPEKELEELAGLLDLTHQVI